MSGAGLLRRQSRVNHDQDSRAIIYDGASVNQLAAMFGLPNTEVARKLRHLAPAGMRSGYPIYLVREAAEHLVKPKVDVEDYIRKIGVRDLPPSLQKDIWTAMNGQLKFEEAQGNLWRTERVQAVWADWHKQVRMTLLLAVDEAERDGEMPPSLYEWFRKYIDRLLMTLHENVTVTLEQMPKLTPGIVDYEQDAEPEVNATAVEEDDDPI